MQHLTRSTMAVLCIEWLLPRELKLNPATVTTSLPLRVKVLFFFVDSVWCSILEISSLKFTCLLAWIEATGFGGLGLVHLPR